LSVERQVLRIVCQERIANHQSNILDLRHLLAPGNTDGKNAAISGGGCRLPMAMMHHIEELSPGQSTTGLTTSVKGEGRGEKQPISAAVKNNTTSD